MVSGDLRVALGLFSYKSDLQWNWMGKFESVPGKEMFHKISKGMVFAFLVHISEFRTNSKLPQKQTRWDLIYVMSILFQETSWGL